VRDAAGGPPLWPVDGRTHPGAGERRARRVRRRREPHLVRRADGGRALRARQEAPGFGEQKAKIFVALLAKQLDVRPDGWDKAAGDYAESGSFRSVADVVDPESLQKVRDFKKAAKASAKAGQG
jgi:uncharacterized HhH-GPD family protein